MEECFSFLCVTTLTWTGNHVALLSLSLFALYVCLLPLDFSLPPRPSPQFPRPSWYAFVPLSLCRCEKHLPLAHSFQASAAGKASDATVARCNAAVPHCSCSVPVHVSRRCILVVHTLFRGAAPDEFIPENMRRDRAKGERINSTLCSNVLLAAAFFLFFFFILDSLIFLFIFLFFFF